MVKIELGPASVVSIAPPEVRMWGPWQFPFLQRLSDGRIQCSYHVERDAATSYGKLPGLAISSDEGKSWKPTDKFADGRPELPAGSVPVPLTNGDLLGSLPLLPINLENARLPKEPAYIQSVYNNDFLCYRLEDVPKEFSDGWNNVRLPKGETEWVVEQPTVRIPGELRFACQGVLVRPWIERILAAPDGSVWGTIYSHRIVDGKPQPKYTAMFLRSTDQGHTWDLWSEIEYQPDYDADPHAAERIGFLEPGNWFMPDGSAICILRTTDSLGPGPMYFSRSTDAGKTWTRPVVWDDLGVWPQILTLRNGVTIAAYGRPGLFVRATTDPSGIEWEPRVAVIEKETGEERDTCSYASLLPLTDDTALIAYSNFHYMAEDGLTHKSIQVRTVKAVKG